MGFKNLPIQRKLTLLMLAVSVFALLLACGGFALYERASFRRATFEELSALAETLGANTAASLAFNDQKTAKDMLGALKGERHILAACLYDSHEKIFAEYRRADLPHSFQMPAWHADGSLSDSESLILFRPVLLGGEQTGSIAIVSDLSGFRAKIFEYAKIALLVLLVSVEVTYIVSLRLVRVVIQPILTLSEIAARVSSQEDYSLRAAVESHDEVGTLVQLL